MIEHTGQEPILSDTFDSPDSLLVVFQMKNLLEIPPNDCSPATPKISHVSWMRTRR